MIIHTYSEIIEFSQNRYFQSYVCYIPAHGEPYYLTEIGGKPRFNDYLIWFYFNINGHIRINTAHINTLYKISEGLLLDAFVKETV